MVLSIRKSNRLHHTVQHVEEFSICKFLDSSSPMYHLYHLPRIMLQINWLFEDFKGVTPDFDLSLSYQISWTDDASFNRIFLMKHLTQKVFNDSLSAVTEPPSGSKELTKLKTSKGINFCYSYPIFIIFLPFDFNFKWLSKLVVSFTNSKPFSQN